MYVNIFKTGIIVFIHNIIICLTSCWPIIFSIKSQFLYTDNITWWDQSKNIHITNNCFNSIIKNWKFPNLKVHHDAVFVLIFFHFLARKPNLEEEEKIKFKQILS
jgi:hypothetical protein